MNPRDQFTGRMRFGTGGTGKGIPVSLDLAAGQMPERNLRAGGEQAIGPNGEIFSTRRVESFEIKIGAGRDGAKYEWKKVHVSEGGIIEDTDGGGTEDGHYAIEANGVTDVPEDSIVTAFQSDVGPWLVFVYGGNSSSSWEWVLIDDGTGVISDATGGSSSHKAKLSTSDGDGTWTETVNIRVKLRGGTVLLNDCYYIGSKNGTVTEGEDVFDLYHVLGNASEILEVCYDGTNTRCDRFLWPANYARIENVDCDTGEPL